MHIIYYTIKSLRLHSCNSDVKKGKKGDREKRGQATFLEKRDSPYLP